MKSSATHDTMAPRKALLKWCVQTCTTYPQVEISNLSTSFRDGLAFCAIIHKHRPDLIDFSFLSRANIYENNQLAFEVAETKLGIPAFLVPKDLLATEVPDYLSVITYLSQFYHYFSGLSHAGPSSLKSSSHITSSNKHSGSPPSSEDDRYSNKSLHNACRFCMKPVHLIQRRVIRGEIWHRSCFRCKVCHGTLAAGFYVPEKKTGCFICSDHITDNNFEIEQTVQYESSETQSSMSRETSPQPAPEYVDEGSDGNDGSLSLLARTEETKTDEPSEFSSLQVTGESKQLASKEESVSLLAAGTQLSQTASSTSENVEETTNSAERKDEKKIEATPKSSSPYAQVPAESKQVAPQQIAQSHSSPFSSQMMGSKNPVKTNHPWLGIIHPGPWTQLPPVQSPGPPTHAKRGPNGQVYWYRPRVPPPNPFGEDLDEEDVVKTELQPKDTHGGHTAQLGCLDLTSANLTQKKNPSPVLTRSLSVPAVKSTKLPFGVTEDNKSNKVFEEKDHCDAKAEIPKSKTCQALTSGRAAAPGHGFPLVKRKVQADQYASAADLQVEKSQVTKQLEALEEKGVELERNIRECQNDEEEEGLVTEWLSLTHERQILMRRDTELVYLTKQQSLEERQADVEYELRRLLNKPESVWSREDRSQEQSLMAELLGIIEQRNQIVSILDQDRKREREEDVLSEGNKNQGLQKEDLKELRKSKGKFKPSKVFKMNRKSERSKNSVDKNS
ncbi:MICAL-like protein 1 isoform X2 [Syngnathus acus]|uniref:MICAL-like protein 1 isoform X2 n=1 Tax=Syngnathus acus TaxID=161584 RepID=UPI001885F62F|nr:MICAL-like protein 1 isoform X2 [Syngnathus acus]